MGQEQGQGQEEQQAYHSYYDMGYQEQSAYQQVVIVFHSYYDMGYQEQSAYQQYGYGRTAVDGFPSLQQCQQMCYGSEPAYAMHPSYAQQHYSQYQGYGMDSYLPDYSNNNNNNNNSNPLAFDSMPYGAAGYAQYAQVLYHGSGGGGGSYCYGNEPGSQGARERPLHFFSILFLYILN
ncbi:hypothetical protein T492DRAFT_1134679 [Pavlovales sp. CCMP2436]|nr:hypothetical protein T492DRAFT_1134679 [Pavlovales sp. CCMP2436]